MRHISPRTPVEIGGCAVFRDGQLGLPQRKRARQNTLAIAPTVSG